MKKNYLIMMLTAFVVGCGSGENPLLGDWLTGSGKEVKITFSEDSMSVVMENGDGPADSAGIDYFVSYGGGDERFYAVTMAGKSQIGLVSIVDGDTLLVWDNGGVKSTATRKGP